MWVAHPAPAPLSPQPYHGRLEKKSPPDECRGAVPLRRSRCGGGRSRGRRHTLKLGPVPKAVNLRPMSGNLGAVLAPRS